MAEDDPMAEHGVTVAHRIEAGGPALAVREAGQGAPVVFLHGFASTGAMWRLAGLMRVEGLRAIAPDQRGHGASGKPHGADDYGLAMVDDVLRVLDALGIEAAHLAGYSMGAEIALSTAARHPGRVLSVVAAGSGWSGPAEAESYARIGRLMGASRDFTEAVRQMRPGMDPKGVEAMLRLLAAHGIEDSDQDMAALAACAGGMAEVVTLSGADIAGIGVPVLGLAGERDGERARIEAMAGVVPDFRMEVLEGRDHLDAVTDPAFAAAVTGFLREVALDR